MADFIASPGLSLIEVFTDPYENERVWKELKGLARQS
jgi:hypothetical protein